MESPWRTCACCERAKCNGTNGNRQSIARPCARAKHAAELTGAVCAALAPRLDDEAAEVQHRFLTQESSAADLTSSSGGTHICDNWRSGVCECNC